MATSIADGVGSVSPTQKHAYGFCIAMLCRDRMAIGYWGGLLDEIRQRPDLYRGKVKHIVQDCERLIVRYESWLRKKFKGVDDYESSIDAAVEFRKEVKRMLFFYEQAMKRICDQLKMPESDLMSRMSVAKDLLDMCNLVASHEVNVIHDVIKFAAPVELPASFGYYRIDEEKLNPYYGHPKTFMGYCTRTMGKLNVAILDALGATNTVSEHVVNVEDGSELDKALGICLGNLANSLVNYTLIFKLANGKDLQTAKAETIDYNKLLKKQKNESQKT